MRGSIVQWIEHRSSKPTIQVRFLMELQKAPVERNWKRPSLLKRCLMTLWVRVPSGVLKTNHKSSFFINFLTMPSSLKFARLKCRTLSLSSSIFLRRNEFSSMDFWRIYSAPSMNACVYMSSGLASVGGLLLLRDFFAARISDSMVMFLTAFINS